MNLVYRALFGLFRQLAAGRLLGAAKRRGTLIYVRVVDGVRRSVILLVLIGAIAQAVTLSFFGVVVTAILLWGGDDRLTWLFAAFALLFTTFVAAAAYLLSERTWIKVSGAADLAGDA